jgi:hypothetical protein
MNARTGRQFWPYCAAVLAFATSTACGNSSSTDRGEAGNQAGISGSAGMPSVGGTAGSAPGPTAGAASGGKGVGGGANGGTGPNGGSAGQGGAGGALSGAGGALSGAGGALDAWDCIDAPPDLCYCDRSDMPVGTPTCSSGFECCFATASSCECADQETCDVGLGAGAISVKACPPP